MSTTQKIIRPNRAVSWTPVDLAQVATAEYQIPMPIIGHVRNSTVGLFYAGKINTVFGDSGSGKSLFSLHLMAEEMKLGHDVLLVDYEDDPATHIGRLRQLGVSFETILKHFIFIQPEETWGADARARIDAATRGRDISIAIVDSLGESMACDGLSGNEDREVAKWMRGVPKVLAATGAAVILLDHVVKSTATSRNSSFASGSHRKRASLGGVAFFVDVIRAPSKNNPGHVRLISRKDRHGHWPKDQPACDIFIRNGEAGAIEVDVVRADPNTSEKFRPTYYMEKVSKLLAEETEPMSKNQIALALGGKKDAIGIAIDRLVEDGYCTSATGPRNAQLITFVKTYSQGSDPVPPTTTDPF